MEDEDDNEDEDGDIKDVHWEALEEVHQVAPSGKTALRAHICTLHCTTPHALQCNPFNHLAKLHCALIFSNTLPVLHWTALKKIVLYVHYVALLSTLEHWISAVGGGRNTSQHNMAFFSSDFSFKVRCKQFD